VYGRVWSARPQTVLISRLRVQNRLRRLPKLAGSDARDTEGIARLSYPDLAEALQARMLADLKAGQFDHPPRNRPAPDECRRVKALEAHIATLEEAVAKAEALGEQRRREAETAAKRGRRSRCRARRDDERALGHTVRLMPSAYVKPYLKQERALFKMIFNVCRDERAEF
jgi:hypothetical protein